MNNSITDYLEDENWPLNSGIQPNVTTLYYRLTHSHPAWEELACKYPNLEELNLNYYCEEENARRPDAGLFSCFPKLKQLSCSRLPLILTPEQIPHLMALEEVNNANILDATSFEVLTGLPAIRKLDICYCGKDCTLSTARSQSLTSLRIRPEAHLTHLVINPSEALTHFDLYRPQEGNGRDLFISLPPSVTSLNLHLHANVTLDSPLPNLGYAVLSGCLPDALQYSKQLNWLTLNYFVGDTLPHWLAELPELTRLSLFSPNLADLGEIDKLTSLNHLELELHTYDRSNPFKAPKLGGLANAPALTTLKIELSAKPQDVSNLVDLINLPEHIELTMGIFNNISRGDQLQKLRGILKNAELSNAEKRHYWHLLMAIDKPKNLSNDDLDARFHLTFMEAKYTPLKALAQEWLRQRALADIARQPLTANSVLFLCGKSGFKASELKEKSAELGFSISKKLDAKVTHILLGNNPKQTATIDVDTHCIIDDSALSQWFSNAAPKFLQQDTAAPMQENMLEMLSSPDEASHLVALQLLEQGGVTDEMLMPLFLILKTTDNKSLRKQIQALLAGFGNNEFQLAVQDKVFFDGKMRGTDTYGELIGEGPVLKKLKGLKKRWGKTLCDAFSLLYFNRFGDGLLWLLSHKEDSDIRDKAIAQLIEGECLNWHKGCGFARMLNARSENERTECHWAPEIYLSSSELSSLHTRLPAELPKQQAITELNLHNCLLYKLPTNIEQYTHVTRLNLSFNPLRALPASLAKLNHLQELDLSYCHFDELPEVLFKLKQLKRLDLRRGSRPEYRHGYSTQHGYETLRAPQAFRDAFPECEILEDELV
ncbi:leucine-rich repeat domain-containing protein [Photobacterium aquae]|uniref:leucine-rich repeat domain-containing protein n=1 Tax=Photobacterium aquae TaxID=1195763 RepID=UPI00069E9CEC|nr:hypothetical protein [Photobacterium aquae]